MRIVKLTDETKNNILEDLLKRSPNSYGKFEAAVNDILLNVRTNKDEALFKYTKDFDKADINASNIVVTKEEIEEAYTKVDPALVDVIRKSLKNIKEYHEKQKQYSWFDSKPDGTILGQKVTPLARAGVYVPGGKAAYPSSVLMNVVPAKVAGVEQIIMCTPPQKDSTPNPNIIAAAKVAGVDRIFLMGGAQAVAALAYGTESVPKVDKIVGPGNIFVATAKKLLYGTVDIDMIAGPSEILIIADKSANPKFLAADLMSQAEHDRLASAILLTDCEELAKETETELEKQMTALSRKDIIRSSVDNFGAVIVCSDMSQAIEFANELAPEHLEVCCENPMEYVGKLDNAGSVFLGNYSPEPLGDYFAGPNHVLPTSGTARFFSPLSVDSFVKKSSFIYYTEDALRKDAEDVVRFAETEGLTAHANSIKVRFDMK